VFEILHKRLLLTRYNRNILKRGAVGIKDKNHSCLKEEAWQNSQSDFEQLIEFEFDTAVNTAGDAQLQHEQKQGFFVTVRAGTAYRHLF